MIIALLVHYYYIYKIIGKYTNLMLKNLMKLQFDREFSDYFYFECITVSKMTPYRSPIIRLLTSLMLPSTLCKNKKT